MSNDKKVTVSKGDIISLRARLDQISAAQDDPEIDHSDADDALIAYIGDERVEAAFKGIRKWYS